jgi:hypothetical protein
VAAVDRVAQWTDKGRVGILRYSWQGGEIIPTEARLLTAWNQFLDQNKRPEKIVLNDVSRGVIQGFEQTPQDPYPRSVTYRGLTESVTVPIGLGTLPIEQATKP